jgi:hypothetical protein
MSPDRFRRYLITYPGQCGPVALRFPDADAVASWLAWLARQGYALHVTVWSRGRAGWIRVDSD